MKCLLPHWYHYVTFHKFTTVALFSHQLLQKDLSLWHPNDVCGLLANLIIMTHFSHLLLHTHKNLESWYHFPSNIIELKYSLFMVETFTVYGLEIRSGLFTHSIHGSILAYQSSSEFSCICLLRSIIYVWLSISLASDYSFHMGTPATENGVDIPLHSTPWWIKGRERRYNYIHEWYNFCSCIAVDVVMPATTFIGQSFCDLQVKYNFNRVVTHENDQGYNNHLLK